MAYSTVPPSMMFVIQVFYAMITNQDLDKVEKLKKSRTPFEPKGIDRMRLFAWLRQFFQQTNASQFLLQFDPTKISPETLDYIKRVKAEYIEGDQPRVTDEKIEKIDAKLPYKLWNWCKCILVIRSKLIDLN